MSERQKPEKRGHTYLADRMARLGLWADGLYLLGFIAIAAIVYALAWNEGIWGAMMKALDAIG